MCVCIVTVVPRPLLESRWMGYVIQVLGFLGIDCCVSVTARVSVDGMCDQCYMAAVLRLKF